MKEYTKLGLALFGIYLIYKSIGTLISCVNFIFQPITTSSAIAYLIITLIWIGIVIVFIKYREKIASWMIKTDELPNLSSDIDWVTLSLRLVCITSGILFLPRIFLHLSGIIYTISYKYKYDNDTKVYFSGGYGFSNNPVLTTALTILTIYLLCGAPHYVRWQSKKIKKSLKSSYHRF